MPGTTSARRLKRLALCTVAAVALLSAGVAGAANPFVDIAGNTHAGDIDAIFNSGITVGCDGTHYCPGQPVTRDQMASFLARTAALSSGATKHFPVVNAKGQSQAYCALAAASPRSFRPGACKTSIAAVDPGNGLYAATAIGADGLPVVSWFNTAVLMVTHCGNLACTTGNLTSTVDNTAINVGEYNAIAIGEDGLPIISYFDDSNNKDLKVAHCDNATCSAATLHLVDAGSGGGAAVGAYTSIAIGTDGFPVISYRDDSNADLKIAHCADVQCAAGTTYLTPDGVGDVGADTSIAIGADGFAIVSYRDATNGDLKVAHCTNTACTSAGVAAADAAASTDDGSWSSITIGIDNLPIISHYDNLNGDLRVVHCGNAACSAGNAVTVVDSTNDVGRHSSIAIGADGFPLISYSTLTNDGLRIARCTTLTCSASTKQTLATTTGNTVVSPTSTAIGPDGVPVIAFSNGFTISVARPPAA